MTLKNINASKKKYCYPYATLKRYVLRWHLKTSTLVMARISRRSGFQSFGAATWNDLSPNVPFVLIDGAARKVPLVEHKLYAPCDFRRTSFLMLRGAMPCIAINVNSNTLMDTLSYRQPVQISHQRRDVAITWCAANKPSCSVENTLDLVQLRCRYTIQKAITIINARCLQRRELRY